MFIPSQVYSDKQTLSAAHVPVVSKTVKSIRGAHVNEYCLRQMNTDKSLNSEM